MRKILIAVMAMMTMFWFATSTHATLWDRGGGFIYDDVRNITWLQDANYAKTSLFNEEGPVVEDYTHVCALTYLLKGGKSAALNLGTGIGHSVREFISMIEHEKWNWIPVHEAKRRPSDPPVLIADASRAERILGWQPQYSDLETIVETARHWHKEGCPDILG